MKKLTWRRIHALLLTVSMIICMFGFDCRTEASETSEQTDGAVKLTVPQNVREENGFIIWDEVEDAYGYTIQAGKDGEIWQYNWYENRIEWNRFIYEHCPMRDFGEYTFKVCAFDETGGTTEFSSPVTVSYQATLSMPGNVVKGSESNWQDLTWDEVEGAEGYNIRYYENDKNHSLYWSIYQKDNKLISFPLVEECLVTVQAMDKDYHVSGWTEEVLVKSVKQPRLATPQNVRFDESGENIIWDEVENTDFYCVRFGYSTYICAGYTSVYDVRCERPMLENWKRHIFPWSYYVGEQYNSDVVEQDIEVFACSYSDEIDSSYATELKFEYTPTRNESINVPQIKIEDGHITWDKAENAFRYVCRIMTNGFVYAASSCEAEDIRDFRISGDYCCDYPEGNYEFELCVIDGEGNYNSKIYPITLDTVHDESVWIPKLYHKFEKVLWDYDRLRHPDTSRFWVRVRKQQDGAVVKLIPQFDELYCGLMELGNGEYTIDACVCQDDGAIGNYDGAIGNWSEPLEIEKHGDGLFEEENETTTEVEAPPEATDIPEEDRITSITINPAFNMKHKDGSNVELDLSKIKIKAKEIYDEEGLKRAEAALGETLNGNKHYNLLDLTLLYDGKDFSNGYDGLVKVIIPLPKGHRDKTFSCYRLTEIDGKVTKEIIPGEQTEDSYIIYLEHFSEYALVAAGPEEPHTHVYSTDWKSDATGHWKECACKDKSEESVHTQDEGTVTKEATKTETGIKTYKCSVCGYVIKTEEIAKLPAGEEPHTHVYSTDWKSDATGHWKECACKDKSEESVHTQDEGTVTKEATKTETGIKTYKCSVCGYVIKTEEIAKLPVDKEPINTKTLVDKEPANTKTSAATKVTKEQQKKNEIIINKKVLSKMTGNSLAVTWNKLPSADGYDIYAASCDNDFKGITASVRKDKTSTTIRKINGRKINGKKTYKVKVKAYCLLSNSKKQYIGTSVVMHVTGSLNKTTTNAKNISLKKNAYALKKGKSAQIRATIIKADRKKKLLSKMHGPQLSYVSSDEAIASVTATGKIKAKKRGKCIIYVRALNGISKKIKVSIN